jgi:heavy metal translocating P-type ATPase
MAVGVGAFLAMNVMMLSLVLYTGGAEADRALGEAWVRWALLGLATPAMLLLGAPLVGRGLRRIRRLSLDTDILIAMGVLAAFALSARSVLAGEGPLYLDTAMGILLFVTIGRFLEASARARTGDALSALAQQMPEDATRVRGGTEEQVAVGALEVGDEVRVRPGERIPVDGTVVSGEAGISEAEITGEPEPVHRGPGATVAAGTLNLDGSLLVRVERTGAETTVARLVRLVTEARVARYPLAPLVDRVAALFVPVVVALALGVLWYWTRTVDLGEGVMNTLSVLVIACPCALGIAIPLAATAASGRAAAGGVLVRSGEIFERLARARRVFLDKTGTLTEGRFEVTSLQPAGDGDPDALLALAAAVERHSEHPIARAVAQAAEDRGLDLPEVSGFRSVAGRGVEAEIGEGDAARRVRVGSADYVGIQPTTAHVGRTVVHVSVDGEDKGTLVLRDAPRAGAAGAIASLRQLGLEVEVLSGDRPESVEATLAELGPVPHAAGLHPEEKLVRVREAITSGESPVMVGDGINDAPALSGAAVGVTLESGTDLAREVADVTILGGDLGRLPWIVGLARRTLRVASFNLFWAFFYNSQRLTRFPLPREAAS